MKCKLATDLSESSWNVMSLEILFRLMSLNVGLKIVSNCWSNVSSVCKFALLVAYEDCYLWHVQ
jgi:hypothetical protein